MEEIKSRIDKLIKGFDVEVLVAKSVDESLVFETDKLLYPCVNESSSIQIRVSLNDGRFGVASSSNLNNVEKVLNSALKIARVSSRDNSFRSIPASSKFKHITFFDKSLLGVDADILKDYSARLLQSAYDNNVSIQNVGVGKSFFECMFFNSNGVFEEYNKCAVSGRINVVKNDITGSDSMLFTRAPDFSSVGVRAVKQCLDSQKIVKVDSSILPVIMRYDCLNDIFSNTLFFAVDGFQRFKGKSPFSELKDNVVANECLSICDNPLLDFGLSSFSFDGEGVPGAEKGIIANGFLKNFLYDFYTAQLDNGLPGNCAGIFSRPSISPSNIIIRPGSKSEDFLIRSCDRALLVDSVLGAHMINLISGDFSNEILKGYLIEKGAVVGAVRDVIISGNFYDLLKNARIVANNSVQKDNLISPSILFDGVNIISQR